MATRAPSTRTWAKPWPGPRRANQPTALPLNRNVAVRPAVAAKRTAPPDAPGELTRVQPPDHEIALDVSSYSAAFAGALYAQALQLPARSRARTRNRYVSPACRRSSIDVDRALASPTPT